MPSRFSPLPWILAFALLALSIMSAPAQPEPKRPAGPPAATPTSPPSALPRALPTEDGVEMHNCFDASCQRVFRTVRKNPYVITVPPPSASELSAAEARDRRWEARCRPTIRQDRYGMPRYSYAAAGCEFGRLD